MPFRLVNRRGLYADGEILLCFERCIRLQICMPALVISGRWRQAENGQKQPLRDVHFPYEAVGQEGLETELDSTAVFSPRHARVAACLDVGRSRW